jgi:hypothetical protein
MRRRRPLPRAPPPPRAGHCLLHGPTASPPSCPLHHAPVASSPPSPLHHALDASPGHVPTTATGGRRPKDGRFPELLLHLHGLGLCPS